MVICMLELLANLWDSVMWVGFLLLFHGRKRSGVWTAAAAFITAAGLTANIEITGCNTLYSAYTFPVDMIILGLYIFFFLADSWWWKLFTVLLYNICIFGCNSICFVVFTKAFHIAPEDLLHEDSIWRWGYLFITKLAMLAVCAVMLRSRRKLKNVQKQFGLLFLFPVLGVVVVSLLMDNFSQFYNVGAKLISMILLMGAVSLLLFFCGYLVLKAIDEWEQKRQNERLKQQICIQEQIYEKQYENFRQAGQIQHDIKHRLVTVEQLLAEGNSEYARKYLKRFLMDINSVTGFECRENVWKTLISIKESRAREAGIICDFDIRDKGVCKVDRNDLCILLGNLLDNAIEAEEKLEGMREIVLRIREEEMIYIQVKNRIASGKNNSMECSTKENGEFHGFGLKSINEIVNKYHGMMQIKERENWHEVEIIILLPQKVTKYD